MINALNVALRSELELLTAVGDQLDALRLEVDHGASERADALAATLGPLLDDLRLSTLHRDVLADAVATEWGTSDSELLTLASQAATPVWGEILTLHICGMHEAALRIRGARGWILAQSPGPSRAVLVARWPRSTDPDAYLTAAGDGPSATFPRRSV
ncbi:hypothetical protein ACTJKO_17390 [Curtobacterium sp. 22159]|uniref:hypothetical protein n=1 Tax=Curtobacterium sp. 22159 TaxID=3453882 RepID=UPI003F86D377